MKVIICVRNLFIEEMSSFSFWTHFSTGYNLTFIPDYANGNIGQEDEDSVIDSEPESDMDLLLESVLDPIDRLYKLAVWIRNPATRLTSSKA